MFLSSLNMRMGAIAAGVLLCGAWWLMGGMNTDPIISIEFGMDPQAFEGLSVEIDGQVAGQLKMYGQATRSGFRVSKGEHTVRVLHPQYESTPVTVRTEFDGQKLMMLLEYEERYDPATGGSTQTLALRH